jgi:single-strand DNA-binding protein
MGRICNDLELKTTQSGVHVLSFRVAVERKYQEKGEERKTDFFNIVAWRSNAEFIHKFFAKGRMILVEGELQTRQYTDKNGANQTIVELIVDNSRFTGEAKQTAAATAPGTPPIPATVPEISPTQSGAYPTYSTIQQPSAPPSYHNYSTAPQTTAVNPYAQYQQTDTNGSYPF